jgi:hypothetical protein
MHDLRSAVAKRAAEYFDMSMREGYITPRLGDEIIIEDINKALEFPYELLYESVTENKDGKVIRVSVVFIGTVLRRPHKLCSQRGLFMSDPILVTFAEFIKQSEYDIDVEERFPAAALALCTAAVRLSLPLILTCTDILLQG